MRSNWVRITLPFIVLLVAALACDVPGLSNNENKEEDLNATETMQALATEVAGTLEPDDGKEASSEVEEAETDDEEAGEASDAPVVSATPTLGLPMVSVSADTNCRSGPGDVYDYLGALIVGEEALVTGKLANESFWYIENPDAPPPYCWIWGMYASVTGDKSGIPVLTPPPTPTLVYTSTPTNTPSPTPEPMDFVLTFQIYRSSCEVIFIRIKNTGNVNLESFSYSVHVPQTGHTRSGQRNFLADTPLCGFTHKENVPPGAHEYLHPSAALSSSGTTTFEISLVICTENDLGGFCQQAYLEETIQNP